MDYDNMKRHAILPRLCHEEITFTSAILTHISEIYTTSGTETTKTRESSPGKYHTNI